MLIVETIGRIRREHLVQGKSIRRIARDLRLSRNTVRRILRSDETSARCQREIQPLPRLGRWKSELDRLLTANLVRSVALTVGTLTLTALVAGRTCRRSGG